MEVIVPSCWVKIIYLSRSLCFSPLPGDCEAGCELWEGELAFLQNLTSECNAFLPCSWSMARHRYHHNQADDLGCGSSEFVCL